MRSYFAAIWRCRYFWLSLVKIDLRARYRGSTLGMGWSFVRPLAMTGILCVVFHRVFNADIRYYAPFVLTGIACWHFLLNVTIQGGQSFFQGESYLRQYPTPLAIYPLRATLGAMVHFLLAMAIVLVMTWLLIGFHNLPVLVSLIPSIILLFIFGWSLAILAGFANVFFRDTQQLAELSLQVLFYITPILYPAHTLRNYDLQWLGTYNPFAAFVDIIRQPVLDGTLPSAGTIAMAAGTTVVFMAAAGLTLARWQRRLIFYL